MTQNAVHASALGAVSALLGLALSASALAQDATPRRTGSLCDAPSALCHRLASDRCLARSTFEGWPNSSTSQSCGDELDAVRRCYADLVVACGPGHDQVQGGRSDFDLLGTIWAGIDSDGDAVTYRFDREGVIDYTTPSGDWRTGEWIRVGDEVLMSMNDGFATYFGRLEGDRMPGETVNVNGKLWTIMLRRQPGVFLTGEPGASFGNPDDGGPKSSGARQRR